MRRGISLRIRTICLLLAGVLFVGSLSYATPAQAVIRLPSPPLLCTNILTFFGPVPAPICIPGHPDSVECMLCCPPPCQIGDKGILDKLKDTAEFLGEMSKGYQELQANFTALKDAHTKQNIDPNDIDPELAAIVAAEEFASESVFRDNNGVLLVDPQADEDTKINQIVEGYYTPTDGTADTQEIVAKRKVRQGRHISSLIEMDAFNVGTPGALEAHEMIQEKLNQQIEDSGSDMDLWLVYTNALRTQAALGSRQLTNNAQRGMTKGSKILSQQAPLEQEYALARKPEVEEFSTAADVQSVFRSRIDQWRTDYLSEALDLADEIKVLHNNRKTMLEMLEQLRYLEQTKSCHHLAVSKVKKIADQINNADFLKFDPAAFAEWEYYEESLGAPYGPFPDSAGLMISPEGFLLNLPDAEKEEIIEQYKTASAPLSDFLRNLDGTTFQDRQQCMRDYAANRAAAAAVIRMMQGSQAGFETECEPRKIRLRVDDTGTPMADFMWVDLFCLERQSLEALWDDDVLRAQHLIEMETPIGDKSYTILPRLPVENPFRQGRTSCQIGDGLLEQWLLHDKYERMYRNLRDELSIYQGSPVRAQIMETDPDLKELREGVLALDQGVDLAQSQGGTDAMASWVWKRHEEIRLYFRDLYGFDLGTADGLTESISLQNRLVDELESLLQDPKLEESLGELTAIDEAMSAVTFGFMTAKAEGDLDNLREFTQLAANVDSAGISSECGTKATDGRGNPLKGLGNEIFDSFPSTVEEIPLQFCNLDYRDTRINPCNDCINLNDERADECAPIEGYQ